MRLISAIVVFLISNYLKLFLVAVSICSLTRYYADTRHVYIILAELMLLVVIALIMFASLALTKMDCNRIANYLLLPALLGLGYVNAAHYHRSTWTAGLQAASGRPSGDEEIGSSRSSLEVAVDNSRRGDSGASLIEAKLVDDSGSLADSIELLLCNGLVVLSLVHLMSNLFNKQLAKILD